MPTYSYECKKCGHTFDVFHSISQTPKMKCTECGGSTQRLMGTGGGIIFKGSGFYETDYKKKSNGSGNKSESTSSGTKGDSKGEGAAKSESAPAKTESSTPKSDKPAAKKE